MAKIFSLAAANVRKSISQTLSLFLLVALSAALLIIGLVLLVQFSSYFDKRAEELNAPHVAIIQSKDITTAEQERYLSNYPGVIATESFPVLSTFGDHYLNDLKTPGLHIFRTVDAAQEMNPPTLIGESLPLTNTSIYVPYLMKVSGGYELGDTYRFVIGGKNKDYTIAGFTEEVIYGAAMNSLYRYYLSDSAYQDLLDEYPQMDCVFLQARLANSEDSLALEIDYTQEFFFSQELDEASSLYVHTIKLEDAKTARTSILMIVASIMMVFSLMLLVICLVVIRFRIVNSIQEGMTNIGALRALGYTSRQIIASIVVQFAGIAVFASIIGLVFAQLFLPTLAQFLESQTALIWNPSFSLGLNLLAFAMVCGVIALTSIMASMRIRKLQPLTALCGGVSAHNFKRNRLPLETARGPLQLLLAFKHLLSKKKQAVMIAVIVAFVSFASVACVAIYYNIGEEPEEFAKVIAGELPDAGLLLENNTDSERVLANLQNDSSVRKAFYYQDVTLSADDINISTIVTENFDELEGNILAEGRYPLHDNEVALGSNAAKALDKHIGDTITVTQGGKQREYLISGIIQLMNSGGVNMAMTYDGLKQVQSDYLFDQIYVYLYDEVDVDEFLKNLESREGEIFSSLLNMDETAAAQLGSYGLIFGGITTIIILVTAAVITLVLFMVMKTAILQRKREFGIQKALGFTTAQLIHQLTLSYLPMIIVGVAAGGIAGFFGFNPLFTLITSGFGILKTELPTPVLWVLAVCVSMVLLAYVVSILVALRIRKVSPQALMSE